MRFYDNLPMGMYGWADEDIGIFGGWRSDGFHKAGHMRCDFIVVDNEEYQRTKVQKQVGRVMLQIKLPVEDGDQPEVVGLIKIEIDKEHRKMGYGRRAVEAVTRAAKEDLPVYDIQKSKVQFWKKLGAQDIEHSGRFITARMAKDEPSLGMKI